MKLRLTLLLMCLFATGLFASAQVSKKKSAKPVVLNGPDAIPIVVTSTKKAHPRKPPPPPPQVRFAKPALPPPAHVKAKPVPPPPPPPVKKDVPSVPVKPTSDVIIPYRVERLMLSEKA